jgi:hypothetical protein
MGEIAHVDTDRLHALAGRFDGTASAVADMSRPVLEPGALPAAVVSGLGIDALLAPQLQGVVADLADWAVAARSAAAAFADTDAVNGGRFTPR